MKAGLRTSRESGANSLLHRVAEGVDVGESSVDVWRDPYAFELFVNDWRRNDPVTLPKMTHKFGRFYSFHAEVRQAARLLWIVRRKDANALHLFEATRPPIFQVSEPGCLAFHPDSVLKRESLGYRVVIGCRVSADLFELANVVVLFLLCGHQRPQLPDL